MWQVRFARIALSQREGYVGRGDCHSLLSLLTCDDPMTDRFHTLAFGRNRLVLDTEVGYVRALELGHEGRVIAPLHVAPWVTDAPIDRDAALFPTEQALAG